ncbi:hypothetical protein RLON56S_02701 [Alishewanella longhuensis]
MPAQSAQHPCCCYKNSTAAKGLKDPSEPSSLIEAVAISNEVVNAEYTLLGEVFFRDEKQQPPGKDSRRAPTKLYGVFSHRMR